MKKIVLNIIMSIICIALLSAGSVFASIGDETAKGKEANKAVLDQTYPNDSAVIAINERLADLENYQQASTAKKG